MQHGSRISLGAYRCRFGRLCVRLRAFRSAVIVRPAVFLTTGLRACLRGSAHDGCGRPATPPPTTATPAPAALAGTFGYGRGSGICLRDGAFCLARCRGGCCRFSRRRSTGGLGCLRLRLRLLWSARLLSTAFLPSLLAPFIATLITPFVAAAFVSPAFITTALVAT